MGNPFLTGTVGIVDSDGERVDTPDASGDYAPIMLKLGASLRATSVVRTGALTEVTIDAIGGDGGSGSIALDTHDDFRALSLVTLVDGLVITFQNPEGVYVYSSGVGAGQADDDRTILRNTNVSEGSHGRAYPVDGAILPTIAALRLAKSGRQTTVQVQGSAGGIFDKQSGFAADNGGTIIVPTGVTTFYYQRRFSGALHAEWFGVAKDALQITDGVRTSGNARLTRSAGGFTAAMVGRKVLIREPDPTSLAAGTMTVGAGTVNVEATGSGTNVVAALPRIEGASDSYEPASGGAVFIGNKYYAAFQVTESTQSLLLYQSEGTQTAQPWYTETQRELTVVAYVSATELTLSATASVSQTNVMATIATDDTTAIRNTWQAAIDLGIRKVVHSAGFSGVFENIGFTDVIGLTIEFENPQTSGFVELRKASAQTAYPNPDEYYGNPSFVDSTGVYLANMSFDANLPVLGMVHSAGGSENNSGSRSGPTFFRCDDCAWINCWSRNFGARDEHLYAQGCANTAADRCRVVGNNNVSINFNSGGIGNKIVDCWATGILGAADSFQVLRLHVTTNNHPRLSGSVTIGNLGHTVMRDVVCQDMNSLLAGTPIIDVFGGDDEDATVEIKGLTVIGCNGLWASGQGAVVQINNHTGTVSIQDLMIDTCTAAAVGGRFVNIKGTSVAKVVIGSSVLRGRAESNMTIGIEVEAGVPSGAVMIDHHSIVYGESIVTRVKLGAALGSLEDMGTL